jgi:hypothetical protein
MRLAFWILLFTNLVLLVWAQGYFTKADEGREPERLERQLNPAQLKIVAGPVATAVATAPSPSAASDTAQACKRISGLSTAEAGSLAKVMNDLSGWQISIVAEEAPPLHWVLIPTLQSRSMAEKKREELRLLGVNEHQTVEHAVHGPFAVSFAMLPKETEAAEILQGLQRKGVRSARIVSLASTPRSAAELRAPATILSQKLPSLVALFASAIVGDCARP